MERIEYPLNSEGVLEIEQNKKDNLLFIVSSIYFVPEAILDILRMNEEDIHFINDLVTAFSYCPHVSCVGRSADLYGFFYSILQKHNMFSELNVFDLLKTLPYDKDWISRYIKEVPGFLRYLITVEDEPEIHIHDFDDILLEKKLFKVGNKSSLLTNHLDDINNVKISSDEFIVLLSLLPCHEWVNLNNHDLSSLNGNAIKSILLKNDTFICEFDFEKLSRYLTDRQILTTEEFQILKDIAFDEYLDKLLKERPSLLLEATVKISKEMEEIKTSLSRNYGEQSNLGQKTSSNESNLKRILQIQMDRYKTNHMLHFSLSVLFLGLWIIPWLLIAQSNASNSERIKKMINSF